MTEPKQPRRHWRIGRDTMLFVLGALGFTHEIFIGHLDRPNLVLACLALMGLPAFLRKDEK